jgi:hypothetical protein
MRFLSVKHGYFGFCCRIFMRSFSVGHQVRVRLDLVLRMRRMGRFWDIPLFLRSLKNCASFLVRCEFTSSGHRSAVACIMCVTHFRHVLHPFCSRAPNLDFGAMRGCPPFFESLFQQFQLDHAYIIEKKPLSSRVSMISRT